MSFFSSTNLTSLRSYLDPILGASASKPPAEPSVFDEQSFIVQQTATVRAIQTLATDLFASYQAASTAAAVVRGSIRAVHAQEWENGRAELRKLIKQLDALSTQRDAAKATLQDDQQEAFSERIALPESLRTEVEKLDEALQEVAKKVQAQEDEDNLPGQGTAAAL